MLIRIIYRHGFLDPAPCVARYRFDNLAKTAHVEWWDRYTDPTLTGTGTWRAGVCFAVVGGWASRPRRDFDDT